MRPSCELLWLAVAAPQTVNSPSVISLLFANICYHYLPTSHFSAGAVAMVAKIIHCYNVNTLMFILMDIRLLQVILPIPAH